MDEIEKFILWYWQEVQSKPYDISASELAKQYHKDTCEHEMVSTEYASQTYGHCMECDSTVVKRFGKWMLP